MHTHIRRAFALVLIVLFATPTSLFASAHNGRPKLVVIIVIDQFRADYLDRFHDRFVESGFRLLTDRGANFVDCNYDYAVTKTAPGHATLGTGAYTDGHGIGSNEWWDPLRNKHVSSVQDENYPLVGVTYAPGETPEDGASPHNLLADTLGDELRLGTSGKSRVFSVSLKDRAAILPAGFSANAAYWLDHKSGAFITSTYYMSALPDWAQKFDASDAKDQYWDKDWKDSSGKTLRSTAHKDAAGKTLEFYDVIGATPYANDHQIAFAEQLIDNENLGQGETTDLLILSFSAFDILGHKVGPNSPEMESMTLRLDQQLSDLFAFLGKRLGLANTWIALSADHGTAPQPEFAQSLHLNSFRIDERTIAEMLSNTVGAKLNKPGTYVNFVEWPNVYLNADAFTAAGVKESDAERMVGEALVRVKYARDFYTKSQLAMSNSVAPTQVARRFQHSFTNYGGWYVLPVPPPFLSPYDFPTTEHYSPYNYNTHVPLAFFGAPFKAGTYRTHAEPVDLAVTLASLLGLNRPTHAVGRVLTEAIREMPDAGDKGDKGPK